ncbi:MAG: ABC transporter permease [Terricaulis sp.]
MRRQGRLTFWIGLALTAAVFSLAALSFFWSPYDVAVIDIGARLAAPSGAHWLGTDQLGRDVFAQLLVGARNSVGVALVALVIGAGFGAPLGLAAATLGGAFDEFVMRAADLVFAFPALLLAIMLTATLGPSGWNAILAIGLFSIPVFARVARGSALALLQRDFILAARAAGKGKARIAAEHVLPNVLDQLVVQATIQFSLAILAEAALSYVGLGVQPPSPSWGRMLSEAQTYVFLAPWLAWAPGATIFVAVLGLSLVGDGLRDLLDPKLRRTI